MRLKRTIVASAGKQPRNHVQNRTRLHRRAGVRARYKNSGYGQLPGGRNGAGPVHGPLRLPWRLGTVIS